MLNINSLVDSLIKEVEQKTSKDIEQQKKKNTSNLNINAEINNGANKENKTENQIKSIKDSHLFLSLNPNGSEYFSSRKRYRKKQPEKEANIFKKIIEKTDKNSTNLKQKKAPETPKNESSQVTKIPKQLVNQTIINLSNVDRQFNIIFRSAYINEVLNSSQYENKTDLLFKFELFEFILHAFQV